MGFTIIFMLGFLYLVVLHRGQVWSILAPRCLKQIQLVTIVTRQWKRGGNSRLIKEVTENSFMGCQVRTQPE